MNETTERTVISKTPCSNRDYLFSQKRSAPNKSPFRVCGAALTHMGSGAELFLLYRDGEVKMKDTTSVLCKHLGREELHCAAQLLLWGQRAPWHVQKILHSFSFLSWLLLRACSLNFFLSPLVWLCLRWITHSLHTAHPQAKYLMEKQPQFSHSLN